MPVLKLRNQQPRVLGLCTGHRLAPGKQIVQELNLTEAQFNLLLKDNTFRSWQKVGWVSIIQESPISVGQTDEDVEPGPEEVLENLKLSDAKDMVQATSDKTLLRAWLAKDSRKGVKKVIVERLESLQPKEEAPVISSEPSGPPDELDEIFGGD